MGLFKFMYFLCMYVALARNNGNLSIRPAPIMLA